RLADVVGLTAVDADDHDRSLRPSIFAAVDDDGRAFHRSLAPFPVTRRRDDREMASRRGSGAAAMHAFPAAHHVLVKSLAGSGRVASGDLVDDVAMLACGYRQRAFLSEGLAPEKTELVDQ